MRQLHLPSASDGIRRAVDLYDAAVLYCLAEKRKSGQLFNVYTAVVRIRRSYVTSISQDPVETWQPSRRGKRTYLLYRSLIDPDVAARFLESAQNHQAELPFTQHLVRYATMEITEAFLPSFAVERWLESPLSRSVWSRRFWSTNKTIGKLTLQESSAMHIDEILPDITDTRFNVLDIRSRLDALGDVEDLYPIALRMHLNSTPSGMRIAVDGDAAWRASFPEILVSGVVGPSMLARSHVSVNFGPAETEILLAGAYIGESQLAMSADGIILDQFHGFFVRTVGVNAYIVERRLNIQMDTHGTVVPVDIARDASAQNAFTGEQDESYNRKIALAVLGRRWRDDVSAKFSEIVLGATDSRPRVEVYSDLVKLIQNVSGEPFIRIVDPFVIDPQALLRIALVAAASRASQVQILTTARQLPHLPLYDFASEVRRVAAMTNVRIEVCGPAIPLHDRFLWIGSRIWHFGHSFNAYGGDDLSVVTEMRNLKATSELRSVLEPQFQSAYLCAP